MDFRIVWSPSARADLKSIVSFIGEEDPPTARKFGLKIIGCVEQAARFPESGRIVPEFENPTVRELILSSYRIAYRVNTDAKEIDIARVWHAKRGIPEL